MSVARFGAPFSRCLSMWLLACLAGGAFAEDSAPVAEEQVADPLGALLDSQAVVSEDDLDTQRAKQAIDIERMVINDQELNGTVSNNSAIDTVTGHNTITGEAFVGTSGFVSSVQNTGNNVLIQNATIVNIEVQP